jgi:predicted nuclease of restriction endonuclease-like (RecB) superfamily
MNLDPLLADLRGIIAQARRHALRSVNTLQVVSNFLIGRRIVEHEQAGEVRAEYGSELLKTLSKTLSREFGKGYSRTNLELIRKFYLTFAPRLGEISQTPSGKLADLKIQTLSGESETQSYPLTSSILPISHTMSATFPLSWSHYVCLLSIANEQERAFYEIEAASEGWSLREMKRQIDSSLYERLALSKDKEATKRLASEGAIVSSPRDLIKNPLVLEFLGLDEKSHYSETDLESAIIDKLEHFLLELGKGFLFEARQKRFTFDEDHFFVDLVFYNRLLRAYVLIDLKIGELKHQDLGQMQMYVNYFDRHVKIADENPTVGIILCKKKKDALVEITLPKDANIHASQYQLYLPSKEELREQLQQAQLEWEERG